jgi:hypothetical protein
MGGWRWLGDGIAADVSIVQADRPTISVEFPLPLGKGQGEGRAWQFLDPRGTHYKDGPIQNCRNAIRHLRKWGLSRMDSMSLC